MYAAGPTAPPRRITLFVEMLVVAPICSSGYENALG
jgi:hypothetical protein